MKNPRERKILIAVLGVAGLVLLVDRVFIGGGGIGPSESSAGVLGPLDAGSESLETLAEQTAAPMVVDAAKPATDKPPIAQRLRLLTEVTQSTASDASRDAFSPAPGWAAESASDTTQMRPDSAQAFRNTYRLDAVLVTGDRRCAVVNGRTVYVGQMIDGYKLLSVHERSATFEINGIRVELGLSRGGPSD